ncbi:hypothetical protein DSM112329_02436 [Paraconexibacter sp. AEG42_29]|uniref:Uncharacterized protein n=1 Tax=Paraconexibacter sp. AEG42_29 TaxID=2997339 RepID=A0AAU7AV37_9ACTN
MRLAKLVLTLLILLAVPPAAASAQTPPPASAGGLTELTDPATCAIAPDTVDDEDEPVTGCQKLAPLLGPQAVLTSPDGRFVYVAGGTDAFTIFGHGSGYGGLTVLARDAVTGTLSRVQCLSNDTSDGAGTGGCDPLTAGVDLVDLAMTADGSALAVAGSGNGSVTFLSRDAGSGRLTEVACVQESVPFGGRCAGSPSLEGVSSVAFSPDGKDLYAASGHHSSIVQLRLADDGALVRKCISADGSSGSCARAPQLIAPGSLRLSTDGRSVYALTTSGITWLTRDTSTGVLSPGGCVVPDTGKACPSGRTGGSTYASATDSGQALAMSGDGRTLVTSNGYYADAQLNVLRRSEADGSLALTGCVTPLPYEEEESEEEEEVTGEDEDADAETRTASTRQAPACVQAPVVPVGGAITSLSDGRFLAIGYGSAAVLTVSAEGAPVVDGCLAPDDNRCASTRLAGSAAGAAALPGGSAVLVGPYGLSQVGPAPRATARAFGRSIRIRVACPAAGPGCSGVAKVERYGANLRAAAPASAATGGRARFTLAPGTQSTLTVKLSKAPRRAAASLTVRRGGRTVRVLSPVTGLRGVAVPLAPRACPSGAVLAGSGTTTRVVRRGNGAVVGCLAGSRPVRLDRFGASAGGPVRIAGRFAAVVLSTPVAGDRTHRAVAVFDLRRGTVRRLAGAAGYATDSGVASLVLKPSGAVAWTACVGARSGRCVGGRGDELHMQDARGARTPVLARHRITALRLNGSELRFQVAGGARTLPLT